MQLKTYQQKALEQLDQWLDALKKARSRLEKIRKALDDEDITDEMNNHPRAAWKTLMKEGLLPAVAAKEGKLEIPAYIKRTATSGEPIPHVCMKVPTGGGKTLLGVASLERMKEEKGFVLWIVPTKAIYEQTVKAFRTREHPYRAMLEQISGGKVKLLEKNDRFTKQDVESYLCIMMLMLPSANRRKDKEFLKIFRDSGGYTSFFPQQDDLKANEKLIEEHTDLETNKKGDWVKHSLINTLKLIRPTVILDEAHKAYGKNNKEFVNSVNQLNPRFVLELSATPQVGISNILVNIGGLELKDEEMIKLPIEIHSVTNAGWQHTLAAAKEKLDSLEKEAGQLKSRENRHIRPIALVRVQRTGKEQREQGYIHAEDAKDYLIRNLNVPEEHIRIQSSEKKELAGEDLLSEMSQVRWIITKDALKEGWDCSFAYILALLDNTTAKTAITQMVGRVMRQPHARSVDKSGPLNRCFVYCCNVDVTKAVEWVRAGLENEGLTGLGGSVVSEGETDAGAVTRTIKRRAAYKKLDIFLPQVLHKDGAKWRPIDYDRDILGALDWGSIDTGKEVNFINTGITAEMRAVVDLKGGEPPVYGSEIDTGETLTQDYFVRRLIDTVPNPWQAARITGQFLNRHNKYDDAKLLKNRVFLSEVLRQRVKDEVDRKAEQCFRDKLEADEIKFHLVTDKKLNYELYKTLEVSVREGERLLSGKHGRTIQQSLFEDVFESDFNDLEANFALCLEQSKAIYWWHRIAARREYSIQGWKRHKVYPDFIACRKDDKLLIMETKGLHLKGNEDTEYKKRLLKTLEATYKTALKRGEMETIGETPAKFRMLFENTWEQDFNAMVAER